MSKTAKGVIAFLVGWIGTPFVAELFGFHIQGAYGFVVGVVLAGIFSGAYREELEAKKKQEQE